MKYFLFRFTAIAEKKKLNVLLFFFCYSLVCFSFGQNQDILQSLLFSPETSGEYHLAKQQWPKLSLELKLPYLPRLLEAIKNPELLTRRTAIWALAYLGENAQPALTDLLTMLHDQEVSIRREVIVALGQIGDPRVAESILPFFGDKDILSQKQARISLYLLGFQHESVRDVLIQGLYHPQWKIRHGSSLILIEIGKQDSLLFSKIALKLQDPDPEIRFTILRIFALTGLLEKEVIEGFFQALKDPVEKVRLEAINSIYQIRSQQANSALAIPFLKNLLNEENKMWRYKAASVLSTFPEEAEKILPILLTGVQDSDEKIHSVAIVALGNIAIFSPEIISTLKKAIQDPNKSVRQQTLQMLHAKGESARELLPEITKALEDSDPIVRLYARQVLQKFQEKPPQENNATENNTTEK
ncbi:MAG: HEAT repeat domain-containing protein [Planctomycetota bacterium]